MKFHNTIYKVDHGDHKLQNDFYKRYNAAVIRQNLSFNEIFWKLWFFVGKLLFYRKLWLWAKWYGHIMS